MTLVHDAACCCYTRNADASVAWRHLEHQGKAY